MFWAHMAAAGGEEIEVFTVEPAQYPQAVLMPNAKLPTPPPPTPEAVRENWWRAQFDLPEGQEPPAAVTVTLGPGSPVAGDRAYLVLTRPQLVHPEATIEFGPDSGAMVAVKVKLVAGESCLLDFAVSGLGPGRYEIVAGSARKTFEDPNAASRRLLIGLRATASGWTSVRLQRTGAGYHLHEVAITGAL